MAPPAAASPTTLCPDAAADELCATRIIWGTLDARLDRGRRDHRPALHRLRHQRRGQPRGSASATPCPGWYAVTSPPTIVRGIAVIGAQVSDGQDEDAPSGVVRGYDAITGEFALGLGPRQSRR